MYVEVRLWEDQVVKDLGIRNDKIIPFVNEFLIKLSAKILKDEEIQRDIDMLTTSLVFLIKVWIVCAILCTDIELVFPH